MHSSVPQLYDCSKSSFYSAEKPKGSIILCPITFLNAHF